MPWVGWVEVTDGKHEEASVLGEHACKTNVEGECGGCLSSWNGS